MPTPNFRRFLPPILVVGALAGIAWTTTLFKLPQADFTFCNGDEPKTIDPGRVTGQPEGNIIRGLLEGLCNFDPATLAPTPGAAERWDISEDGLTYTFYIRPEARWSNGDPVTAHDFEWSMRRFLHPGTGSEYAYEMWYVTGAKDFTSSTVETGDIVEIEDKPIPDDTKSILRAKVVEKFTRENDSFEEGEDGKPKRKPPHKLYRVEVDGKEVVYAPVEGLDSDYEIYGSVHRSFDTVAIKALDDRRLQIKLDHPVPYFLRLMGFYPMFPVHRPSVQKHGYPGWTKPENFVGNGPFNLQIRRIRDRIRLVKSETYWNKDDIHLNTVDILAVKSLPTQLNLYMTGQADWISKVSAPAIPEIMRSGRTDFDPTPFLATYYYRVNVRRPPLDDERVRRAIAMSINKQAIVDSATRGGQIPTRSFVPPQIRDYLPYTPPECEAFDPQKARELLAAAGYPGGRGMRKIELLYNSEETHRAVAEMIQQDLQNNLGITIGLVNQEWAAYQESTRLGKFDISRAAWIGDYIDPNTFLTMWVKDGSNNQTGWFDGRYDELLEAAKREANEQKRLAMFHEAETILMRQMPIIPIYMYTTPDMIRPYVKNFPPNILNMHSLNGVSIDHEEKARILAEESR